MKRRLLRAAATVLLLLFAGPDRLGAATVQGDRLPQPQSMLPEVPVGELFPRLMYPAGPNIVEPLADTVFASAACVKYVVERHETDTTPIDVIASPYSTDDILLFRKSPLRDAGFGGTLAGRPTTIEVVWRFNTAMRNNEESDSTWGGGSGWTGQPLYLAASDEIVVGSLCGKVYFIDFATGTATREPLDVKNPIKGTVAIDPHHDNLYVGHGIPEYEPFGISVFDLARHEQTFTVDFDYKALRWWGAYDSNPVVAGEYLFWCGENGSVYKFRREQGRLIPAATMRYTVGGLAPGIENSLCVYRNYGFFGDNHGNIIAINLDTMKPVWRYDNHDDIDATIVCREEEGHPCLYAGCEVDKQGDSGTCHIVKLDAVTGLCLWERRIEANRYKLGEKYFDGGLYGTPLLGRGDCEELLFVNLVSNGADGGMKNSGEMVALDTATGRTVYTVPLGRYAWSSPVSYLDGQGVMYILTGDTAGTLYLIEGRTGAVICRKQVGYNFESSPIAVGNAAVVGSRGNGIFKVEVR